MVEGLSLAGGIADLPQEDWDAIANPPGPRPQDPFLTHRFLSALELSGSVGAGTGWLPRPLCLHQNGRLVGALPLYVKDHSQGEYIFDHAFAEAYERAGGRYYPKLQVAVPFTPVTGNRLLGGAAQRKTLWQGAIDLAQHHGLSSLHATFCTAEEASDLAGLSGSLHRVTNQYHWENPGYNRFDDFLAALSSRKRKAIRKERETARAHGLTIQRLTGDDIKPDHWQAFWDFYQDTGARKWGRPYLTRNFFDRVHDSMRQDVLLVLALDQGRAVAGALNFIGSQTLFGRYWGALADYPCLHFELCYYQAMDFAIENRLRIEAGAQGEHKIARGYLPRLTHSLHWFRDPGLQRAVGQYLGAEARAMSEEIEALARLGPYRKPQDDKDDGHAPGP